MISVLLTLSALAVTQVAAADNNSGKGRGNGNAFGKSKNIGVGNASDGIKGRIVTDRDIFYTGDPLSIGIKFPRGGDLITDGLVDSFLVAFSPIASTTTGTDSSNGTDDVLSDAIVLPVSSEISEDERQLFSIDAVDAQILPAGTYQLGLILTNPGGNPLLINDWYGGLLGLIDVVGLTVSGEFVEFDLDGDGEIDDDADGDGFSDDDDDEEEDENADDNSDDSNEE